MITAPFGMSGTMFKLHSELWEASSRNLKVESRRDRPRSEFHQEKGVKNTPYNSTNLFCPEANEKALGLAAGGKESSLLELHRSLSYCHPRFVHESGSESWRDLL